VLPSKYLIGKDLYVARGSWSARYSFALEQGEWLGILGPSGAGKSTLLHALLGLVPLAGGEIMVGAKDVTHLAPNEREMSIVFQNSMLLGHLTLVKSLMLAMHDRSLVKSEKVAKIAEYFDLLRLKKEFLRRYPEELSGGELARCNLCCALLREKKILLLDEPFAALNEKLRGEISSLLKKIQAEKNLTILAVTHQVAEAKRLSSQLLHVLPPQN
jgi:ABC-type Fe3+/spermidine/putrescine transport system ATPase subunit